MTTFDQLFSLLTVAISFWAESDPNSRLEKCKLSQVPTAGRAFAQQIKRDWYVNRKGQKAKRDAFDILHFELAILILLFGKN